MNKSSLGPPETGKSASQGRITTCIETPLQGNGTDLNLIQRVTRMYQNWGPGSIKARMQKKHANGTHEMYRPINQLHPISILLSESSWYRMCRSRESLEFSYMQNVTVLIAGGAHYYWVTRHLPGANLKSNPFFEIKQPASQNIIILRCYPSVHFNPPVSA